MAAFRGRDARVEPRGGKTISGGAHALRSAATYWMERWANAIAPGPTGVDVATTAANLDAMDVGQMLNYHGMPSLTLS